MFGTVGEVCLVVKVLAHRGTERLTIKGRLNVGYWSRRANACGIATTILMASYVTPDRQ
jgi:hypothetical protein